MARPTHRGSPTHAHDLASLLEKAHLLRAHAAHVGKLPNERFQQAYVRVSSALVAHLDGTSPQPSDAQAALESELLGLYNQLALAIAPVSAESIRSTETARNAAVFFPTVFAVAFSAAVFLLVVLLQSYGVIGKGLRDSIQQQDAKRKELVQAGGHRRFADAHPREPEHAGGPTGPAVSSSAPWRGCWAGGSFPPRKARHAPFRRWSFRSCWVIR